MHAFYRWLLEIKRSRLLRWILRISFLAIRRIDRKIARWDGQERERALTRDLDKKIAGYLYCQYPPVIAKFG